MAAVKSLFSFGHRLGYLPFDVGRAVKQPRLKGHARRAHLLRRNTAEDGVGAL